MSEEEAQPQVSPAEFLGLLGAVLQQRRGAITTRAKFGFALTSGEHFLLDPLADPPVVEGQWEQEPEVVILTNAQTLSDLTLGRFDPDAPQPGHVFLCSGDQEALKSLGTVLSGTKSWLGLRASLAKGDSK